MRNMRSQQHGFTLIELLICIAMAGIFLGAATPLALRNRYESRATRDRYAVHTIALNRLEALRALSEEAFAAELAAMPLTEALPNPHSGTLSLKARYLPIEGTYLLLAKVQYKTLSRQGGQEQTYELEAVR